MKYLRTFGPAGLLAVLVLVLAACGGGSDEAVATEPTAAPAPTAIEAPAATETPAPTATPEPTAVPPTAVPPTAVPPTAVPTEEPVEDEESAGPATEGSEAEQPATEDPDAAGPATDGSEAETPAAEEPATEDPDAAGPATEDPTAEDPAPQDPAPQDPVPVAADGAAIFSSTCATCHGASGAGSARGPSIVGIGQFFTADASPLIGLVTNGGQNMPEFGSKLSTEEIAAVVQYVVDTFQ